MIETNRLELWGGHECTVNRTGDRFVDQNHLSGHHDRPDDLRAFAELGIKSLRYPVLWERVAEDPDFTWATERLGLLRDLGINPIVGLIHHGSGPAHTNLLDDEGFATGLAAHAAEVAARFPWVRDWTPVNEPLTTARFSANYGLWYPHLKDEGACWRALLNQIDATRLSMRAIRAVNPDARLIQTDDLGMAESTPPMARQARFENHRRWLGWDLLCGMVVPGHPLWDRLCRHGLEARLRVIADDPCPPDVIGINHYICSNRYLTHEFARHPDQGSAGDGEHCVNLDAIRTVEKTASVGDLIRQTWQRYGRTIAITECHNGCHHDEQMRWFAQTWAAAQAARADGIDIVAVTAWSLLGAHDWNSLLTRFDGHYEAGVFDVRGGFPRPTAMAGLLKALTTGTPVPHPEVVAAPGWWQRPDRFLPGYGRYTTMPKPEGRPILITGGTGTLAQAIARVCERRGLAHVLTRREDIDLLRPETAAATLDRLQPWAVINCAGIVDIDFAEREAELCHLVNAVAPGVLAAACAERGLGFVQISTDQVFDGTAAPYTEDAPVAPLNAYGATNAQAEAAVLAAHPQALVVRTSAFFSPDDRHNFAVHVTDRLAAGERVRAAADEIVSPTYMPDLVQALLDLMLDDASGIWHLASAGGMSWADFARAIAVATGHDPALVEDETDVRRDAVRPRDVRLATMRGQLLPGLEAALGHFADYYAPPAAAYATAAE